MLTLRKHRTEIPIQQLMSVALVAWGSDDILWHFHNLLRNYLIWLFASLFYRIFLLNLKLWRHIFLETHGRFSINLLKLWFFRYFLVLGVERVLWFSELFFEYELAPHKKFAGDDDIEKTVLIRINVTMLVDMRIESGDFCFDFINKRFILDFLDSFMAEKVLIKLLK